MTRSVVSHPARAPAGGVSSVVRPLSRNRDFSLLWTGGVLSNPGSASTRLAVPLLVLAVTGSPARAGLAGSVGLIVTAVATLPGGAAADRWRRRRVMITCDLGRFVLAAVVTAAVLTGTATFALVLAVVAGIAVFDAAFSPAETAALGRLVPAEQLPQAFGRSEARAYASSLAGPSLGGLLFGIGRAVPFMTDAVSYLISLSCVASIRTPVDVNQGTPRSQSVIADVRDGIAHVAGSAFLRSSVAIAAPLNVAVTGAIFTVTLALRGAGVPASRIGLAQGLIGVGGLLGAVVAARLQARFTYRRLVLVVTGTLVVATVTAALLTGWLGMTAPIALSLLVAPSLNAALFGRLARTTPDAVQGRVISVVVLSATAPAALAPFACGLLVDHAGAMAAMFACAIPATAALLVALSARGLDSAVRGSSSSSAAGGLDGQPE